jgi:hypothetical protein
LWGWEPKEFTRRVYEDGVLVGSVTERESEFDAEQRALLLAHMDLERDKGSHGQPMSEATNDAADPAKSGTYHYKANKLPRVDWAARAVGIAQEAYYSGRPKDESRAGHLWYANRIDD